MSEAGAATVAASADSRPAQLPPRQTEQNVAAIPVAAKEPAVVSKQQQYQDLQMQKISANGGPASNPSSTRKYLKVDRVTYLSRLNN